MVHLVKRLLGEGCRIRIWDPNVALGQLIGSNRQFIQDAIPHIGQLLRDEVADVVDHAEVLIVTTKEIPPEAVTFISQRQMIVNLATLEVPKEPMTLHAAATF
jgi:GDP-mannose 6-dehydrogenase